VEYTIIVYYDYGSGVANPKFSSLSFSPAAGGEGGSRKKLKENFGVCPRDQRERGWALFSAIGAYASVPSHHALRACEVGSDKG